MDAYYSAQHWDRVYDNALHPETRSEKVIIDSMVSALGKLQGQNVLDIGAGNGHLACSLADLGAHVEGVDISSQAITHASAVVRRRGLENRVVLTVMNALRLAFEDRRFHFATYLRTIWTFQDPESSLREASRVLIPGGLVVIQLWGKPRENPLVFLGLSVLSRHIPEIKAPSGVASPFDFTTELLEKMLVRCRFGSFVAVEHRVKIELADEADYWREFGSLAHTADWLLRKQSTAKQQLVCRELEDRVSRIRDIQGAFSLPLSWFICVAQKQTQAA